MDDKGNSLTGIDMDLDATTPMGTVAFVSCNWYAHRCTSCTCDYRWQDQTESAQCPLCGSDAS
jgi:rubrerythrin